MSREPRTKNVRRVSLRARARIAGACLLAGGGLLLALIAGIDSPHAEPMKPVAMVLVVLVTLPLAWGAHRFVRSRDPHADQLDPDHLSLLLAWLLDRWSNRNNTDRNARLSGPPVPTSRTFATILAGEIVALRRDHEAGDDLQDKYP